ncbi:calcineurin-binding protein 1 [Telopea speciosissima]|uniref:calcineurin-binding protein 1 n=1 Tax=Telopea speciosissima TaxID=54955 RepID=UPI001CC68DE1|nr:calcineurin-binding protein 1 [Telopea speciosissima]
MVADLFLFNLVLQLKDSPFCGSFVGAATGIIFSCGSVICCASGCGCWSLDSTTDYLSSLVLLAMSVRCSKPFSEVDVGVCLFQFSIAAINDTDSKNQWEPLAPTKEAQEFHLSKTYHEGLLKLQAKEYAQARELLESVLKDPLISSAQADSSASDGHLLQLRFLTLKNLANVFVQQGPMHYENALHCYLQAVEIDTKDSVVWNQLGTLSCSMGVLNISRWAFEQGLSCSPNNWNCMEKLLEVLIAIGDEVACLSVSELILRHWPSHSRALHVRTTIEESESVPFAPRGIDKLEPKHIRLKFPGKRKATDDLVEGMTLKRRNQNIELHLTEASWGSLADAILEMFLPMGGSGSEQGVGPNQDDIVDNKLGCTHTRVTVANADSNVSNIRLPQKSDSSYYGEKFDRCGDIRLIINLPSVSGTVIGSSNGKGPTGVQSGENGSLSDYNCEKATKEKEASIYEEHHQERRSTRLERLRSRKPGKEELDFATSKDLAKEVIQFLEPFIIGRAVTKDSDHSSSCYVPCPDIVVNTLDSESSDVARFVMETSNNYGAFHMVHLLLEEVAHRCLPYQEAFIKFLELEKLTRHWGKDRSPECSLFLAELYYDLGSCTTNEFNLPDFVIEASYHLCKVIELVALDYPTHLSDLHVLNSDKDSRITTSMDDLKKSAKKFECMPEKQSSTNNCQDIGIFSADEATHLDSTILTKKSSFWVRFFWLSGHLSIFSGEKAKALEEFCIASSLLRNRETINNMGVVPLPHCKLIRALTVERIQHEINLFEVDVLLTKTIDEMIEKKMYLECANLLSPLLLSSKDVYLDLLPGAYKEGEGVTPVELRALDALISVCEKTKPMDVEVYLNCHRRKLQILTVAAGMAEFSASDKSFHKKSMSKTLSASELESLDSMGKHWSNLIAEEVKAISRSASLVKTLIDHTATSDSFQDLVSCIGDIQSLLLTVMCNIVGIFLSKKSSGSGTAEQTELKESRCFVDAAIAFFKLQHLNQTVPVKSQVELIVAIHDLLAEYGLCCAGKDSEGEEGTFLKLAIKHLLALHMKLKSSSHLSNGVLEATQFDEQLSHSSRVKKSESELKLNISPDLETGLSEKDKVSAVEKDFLEEVTPHNSTYKYLDKDNEGIECGKHDIDGKSHHLSKEKVRDQLSECTSHLVDAERKKVELGIDDALEQSFFCLYGLHLRSPDSSSEDDLAIHKNTSRGDYQTKEQCADVFQYILPYAKASSRAGLVKLRRVLRAIRKHFPQPPDDVLTENSIDNFLDNPDLCEDKLSEEIGSDGFLEYIMNIIFPNGRSVKQCKPFLAGSSEPHVEVYSNLFYLLAQAEEMSATDKWPGFVLTKEGEEFVEQNANLFKYDLLYNPSRFDSWQRLANIYDEEVDLLLNDGSKHINVVGWRKNDSLPQRVESSRRRSRRCLLMSLALAKTPVQQSEIHELLALVYYDGIQNVVPFYDQRSVVPTKDAVWMMFCQNAMKHFEKAFAHKPEWSHAFYLGKLSEKLGFSHGKTFSYYDKAIGLNPSAVDPVYRMHASRLKLLSSCAKQNLDALQVVTLYCFSPSTRETVMKNVGRTTPDIPELPVDAKDGSILVISERNHVESHHLEEAWHLLYNDCLSALEICVEGDLKHFHKARYMLAQGLYRRGEKGDLERAKDELSFCFKSSRSSFTINMWEIDGMVKKGRRKTPGLSGNRKALEVNLPESSRKYITCIRKYILLYLKLLEETGDLFTLERAYVSLRADKRFSLCLEDLVPVALGRYTQALIASIHQAESQASAAVNNTFEQMLERMFNLFIDQGNLWTDINSLPEIKSPELFESSFYGYLHQYIDLLERDVRLVVLEGINEKLRKRFKNPKLSNGNCAKVCRHASVALFRSIVISLALITPLHGEAASGAQVPNMLGACLENSLHLCVDLQANELWNSSFEDATHLKDLETKWSQVLSNIKNIIIKQASEENVETAVTLLRSSYNFYRESSCVTLPLGIKLCTVPYQLAAEATFQPGVDGVDVIDLSIPRKLLLWAYMLVHGRYSNISAVVKYCEEIAKSKMKRGTGTSSATSHSNIPTSTTNAGGGKERVGHDECSEVEDTPSTTVASASLPEGEGVERCSNMPGSYAQTQKSSSTTQQLLPCCNSNKETTGPVANEIVDSGQQ